MDESIIEFAAKNAQFRKSRAAIKHAEDISGVALVVAGIAQEAEYLSPASLVFLKLAAHAVKTNPSSVEFVDFWAGKSRHVENSVDINESRFLRFAYSETWDDLIEHGLTGVRLHSNHELNLKSLYHVIQTFENDQIKRDNGLPVFANESFKVNLSSRFYAAKQEHKKTS